MARGESAKDRPQGPGLVIGAVFFALCLASLTLVATCTDLGGCSPAWLGAPMPAAAPFAGAASALAELGWRDTSRARPAYAPPVTPDPAAARVALGATLAARGYVEAEPADDARARDLPFDATVEALDGACGVIALLGVAGATLDALEGPEGAIPAPDPSVVTLAACGAIVVRALGTGRATIAVWQLPGVTPADVAATGVSADALLAHAEAETLWRARGWEPSRELSRVEHTGRAASPGAPPARPASGCVAWVGVIVGAGRAETTGSAGILGRDHATERALFGAFSCADGAETSTHAVDPGGDGLVVYWRAWGSAGGGPSRASARGAVPLSATSLRVVDRAALTLPEPFARSAGP